MELRQLRYFLAVAEHLNFGRAAEALRTAQPALSQQIRKLEREAGGPLFERTKRYVKLTPLGQDLTGEALAIVESVDRLTVRLRDASAMPRGRLRVGSITPATVGLVPRMLPTYRERFPLVDLVMDTVALDEQVSALVERRIDVGLLRGPISDDRILTLPIVREYYCVAVPAAHPLARAPFVRLADLDGETWVWLRGSRGGSYNTGALEMLHANGVRVGGSIEASDTEASFALVASNAGLCIASTVICGLQFEGVVYRALIPSIEIGTMILACRRDRRAVAVIDSFIDHVKTLDLTFAPPARARLRTGKEQ
jgi:DNA-binding transcriptional LysR family regulator